VVNCKAVGSGEKALVYLEWYQYRWVIQEKSILSFSEGHVTFRYQKSETNLIETRTLPAVEFLRLILQHVLPKRFGTGALFIVLASQQQAAAFGVTAQKSCRLATPSSSNGTLLVLWRRDEDCADTHSNQEEEITKSRGGLGEFHVERLTPQACPRWQAATYALALKKAKNRSNLAPLHHLNQRYISIREDSTQTFRARTTNG
jgi:hypothetical protein